MVYEILPTIWSCCKEKTHAAQTDPKKLAPAITKFHSKLLRVRRPGVYQTKDIANMDQTPLPFVLENGKTYADKGISEVWCVFIFNLFYVDKLTYIFDIWE